MFLLKALLAVAFVVHVQSRTCIRGGSCRHREPSYWKEIENAPGVPSQIGNPGTRDAWIQTFAASVPAGAKVIDVSAGAKPYKELWRHTQYYTHEFSHNSEIIDTFRSETRASQKSHDFGGDVTHTTAPSGEFDVVILTEVLEHVPEPLEAIREMARLAKPGGSVLVTAPFTSGTHQAPYHYYGGFGPNWYSYAGDKHGLKVVSITSQGDLFRLMAQEVPRALSCGGTLQGVRQQSAKALSDLVSTYLLKLSSLKGDAGVDKATCADQFTIGWMVHYRKTPDQ